MGQSVSLSLHKQPGRKTEHIRSHDHDFSQSGIGHHWRRSSLGGRLRSFAAALHYAPSPVSSTHSFEHTSNAPSPVLNDVVSVRRRSQPLLGVANDDFFDTLASTVAALEQAAATGTPRSSRLSTPPTPSSLASSFASSYVRAPSSVSIADVAFPTVASSSSSSSTGMRMATDRIGSSSLAPTVTVASTHAIATLADTTTGTATTLGNSRSNNSAFASAASPIHHRLPRLRLNELEQIFTAIVTSDDKRARTKLALASA